MENEQLDNQKDYLETIEEMKNTMVSRDALNKALEENKRLIKTIANGNAQKQEETKKEETKEEKIKRHAEAVNILLHPNGKKGIELTNAGIEFRQLTKELYGVDPAIIKVSSNNPINDAEELTQKMNKVEERFKHCIEDSDKSEEDFLNEVRKAIDPGTYPKIKK